MCVQIKVVRQRISANLFDGEFDGCRRRGGWESGRLGAGLRRGCKLQVTDIVQLIVGDNEFSGAADAIVTTK